MNKIIVNSDRLLSGLYATFTEKSQTSSDLVEIDKKAQVLAWQLRNEFCQAQDENPENLELLRLANKATRLMMRTRKALRKVS